jgi:hypothetical protein
MTRSVAGPTAETDLDTQGVAATYPDWQVGAPLMTRRDPSYVGAAAILVLVAASLPFRGAAQDHPAQKAAFSIEGEEYSATVPDGFCLPASGDMRSAVKALAQADTVNMTHFTFAGTAIITAGGAARPRAGVFAMTRVRQHLFFYYRYARIDDDTDLSSLIAELLQRTKLEVRGLIDANPEPGMAARLPSDQRPFAADVWSRREPSRRYAPGQNVAPDSSGS